VNADKQVPRHVAIIMDGNGRWAEANGLSRPEGHAEGARAVREAVRTCCEEGVEYLTLYAFSVANWGRPRTEVRALMSLLLDFAEREKHELFERGVRLQVIGDVDELPMSTRHALERAMAHTANCRTMTLSLALSYGGRADIVNAARNLAARARAGNLLPEEITEDLFQKEMSTHALPPVDLLVRTGGELRVSDFLLFESAYAELYFLPIMWPDFDAEALRAAFDFFRGRERRFGLTREQATQPTVTGVFKRGQTFDPLDSSSSRLNKEAAGAEPG
jgi:undecaprenyl diphosphate synthase